MQPSMPGTRPEQKSVHAASPALSPPEREFQAILDAAVDAIVVIDHRGDILHFSQSAQQMFGYSRAEIVGRNVRELMPEPFRGEHDGYMANYMQTGQARIIGIGREVEAQRSDGSTFPCELAVGRVAGMDPPRFIGFIRDITLRKESADRLQRSETELRLAQELANLGNYVLHTADSTRDYLSPQLKRILEIPEDAPYPTREEYLAKWVHPGDRRRIEDALSTLDSSPGPLDIEYRVLLEDGRQRHLHHIAQALRGPDGQIEKFVGTIHDVTDRRFAEEEARQLQERLTHFSRLSTMGEMAAGLAHEINQPLSAIATYSQACRRLMGQPAPDHEAVLSALEQINAQALRAGEVIRRLRAFVKNREVTREPVDCRRLLEDLRTLAEPDARLHNIQLRIETDTRLPTVYADPIQLQQVVLNLVRNAIDALTEADEEDREVVLTARRTGEREIEVTVSDRGPGLAMEATDHLFNPFFTTKSGGTGLGLAISRSIVRAHGGRLWHTPNEGRGAKFHFTVPASPDSTGDDA